MTILLFLLLLSVIITIHEAGHLIAAKLLGVYCYEFSFGMGPLIWKKKGKETQYSIRAIPMGGYVSMAGEPDGDALYPDVEVPEERRLINKKTWQKIVIMLAGVTMNFLLAWSIFSMVILSSGTFIVPAKAEVISVNPGSPAETAGFEPGDVVKKIIKADGSSADIDTFLDMQIFNADNSEEETYIVDRNGEEITLKVTPKYDEELQTYLIGITGSSGTPVPVNALSCWKYGAQEMVMITKTMLRTIKGLFAGRGLNQLSGPVGIYQATETYAAMGFASYLLLVGQLSLNVGIFTLLPLPILDGGQVVIALCEGITRRKFNEKVKTAIMAVCWVLIIGLMVFVTWNDISKLLFH